MKPKPLLAEIKMRKIFKLILLLLVIGFVVLQFFQPKKNLEATASGDDLLAVQQVPNDVALILKNSCYDCHSNNTRYLWYHHISPVSWMVNHHVEEGKHELNFSEWGKLDLYDQITTLEEIGQETKRKTMPLKSYLLMHPGAKLTQEQIDQIETWTNELGEQLLKKSFN